LVKGGFFLQGQLFPRGWPFLGRFSVSYGLGWVAFFVKAASFD
jgi:hypothetical protein